MISYVLLSVIITPIQNILDLFFNFFLKSFDTGIAIIGLSFVVSLLCLPLYIVAEKWQQVEREKQNSMKKMLSVIKNAFKGDERYMMTNAFYKEERHHPIMALRSSFGLLIQIPFFIAAYKYLSISAGLLGNSFLFIKDLGRPDALFTVGNFGINILPIAMTLINIIAGLIYTKGFSVREKLQIYGMALVFLAILYNSPASLVLYWTFNNIFSLVKNVFYKFKHPLLVFYILCSIFAVRLILFAIKSNNKYYTSFFTIVSIVVILTPLILKFGNYFIEQILSPLTEHKKIRVLLFILSVSILTLTAGLAIPATATESSSSDYFYIEQYISPAIFLFTAFLQSFGLFFFYPLCLYALFSQKAKTLIAFIATLLAFWGILNCFAFSGDYGHMNIDFSLMDESQSFVLSPIKMTLNILLSIAIALFILISISIKISLLNSLTRRRIHSIQKCQ